MIKWTFEGREINSVEDIGSPFGFVYQITTEEGKTYIGSKQVISKRKKHFGKKKLAQITDKRLKKYEYIISEAKDWKEYTGSSKHLNLDIENGIQFKKEILFTCETKTELKFREAKMIICEGALEDEMSYNANISLKQVGKVNFNKE